MYSTNIQEASTALSQVVFSSDVDATLGRKNKVLMEQVHVTVQSSHGVSACHCMLAGSSK